MSVRDLMGPIIVSVLLLCSSRFFVCLIFSNHLHSLEWKIRNKKFKKTHDKAEKNAKRYKLQCSRVIIYDQAARNSVTVYKQSYIQYVNWRQFLRFLQ